MFFPELSYFRQKWCKKNIIFFWKYFHFKVPSKLRSYIHIRNQIYFLKINQTTWTATWHCIFQFYFLSYLYIMYVHSVSLYLLKNAWSELQTVWMNVTTIKMCFFLSRSPLTSWSSYIRVKRIRTYFIHSIFCVNVSVVTLRCWCCQHENVVIKMSSDSWKISHHKEEQKGKCKVISRREFIHKIQYPRHSQKILDSWIP